MYDTGTNSTPQVSCVHGDARETRYLCMPSAGAEHRQGSHQGHCLFLKVTPRTLPVSGGRTNDTACLWRSHQGHCLFMEITPRTLPDCGDHTKDTACLWRSHQGHCLFTVYGDQITTTASLWRSQQGRFLSMTNTVASWAECVMLAAA